MAKIVAIYFLSAAGRQGHIWEEATVKLHDETSYTRIDVIWKYLFKMQILKAAVCQAEKCSSVSFGNP